LTQGHDERHHLVGTRAKGEFGQGTEWPGAVAKRQPGSVIEQPGRADIAEVSYPWWGEGGVDGLIGLDTKGQIDAGDLVIGAARRFDDQEVLILRREHNPVAPPQGHQLAGLEEGGHLTFLKISGRAATVSARLSL